ncbi:MAG: hypothetical protein HYS07_04520, partial [Chlamydiae bacterium]|nr:hypothetical protein [Chlamydiota bacterium]MBI3277463.1 hypothetical protein [Chlamydiota bacterium]
EKGNLSSEEFDQWEKSVPHLKPVIQSLREKHKGVRNSGFDPELMNHLKEIRQLLNSGGTIQKLTKAYLKESLGDGYEEFRGLLEKYAGSDKRHERSSVSFLGYRHLGLMGQVAGVTPDRAHSVRGGRGVTDGSRSLIKGKSRRSSSGFSRISVMAGLFVAALSAAVLFLGRVEAGSRPVQVKPVSGSKVQVLNKDQQSALTRIEEAHRKMPSSDAKKEVFKLIQQIKSGGVDIEVVNEAQSDLVYHSSLSELEKPILTVNSRHNSRSIYFTIIALSHEARHLNHFLHLKEGNVVIRQIVSASVDGAIKEYEKALEDKSFLQNSRILAQGKISSTELRSRLQKALDNLIDLRDHYLLKVKGMNKYYEIYEELDSNYLTPIYSLRHIALGLDASQFSRQTWLIQIREDAQLRYLYQRLFAIRFWTEIDASTSSLDFMVNVANKNPSFMTEVRKTPKEDVEVYERDIRAVEKIGLANVAFNYVISYPLLKSDLYLWIQDAIETGTLSSGVFNAQGEIDTADARKAIPFALENPLSKEWMQKYGPKESGTKLHSSALASLISLSIGYYALGLISAQAFAYLVLGITAVFILLRGASVVARFFPIEFYRSIEGFGRGTLWFLRERGRFIGRTELDRFGEWFKNQLHFSGGETLDQYLEDNLEVISLLRRLGAVVEDYRGERSSLGRPLSDEDLTNLIQALGVRVEQYRGGQARTWILEIKMGRAKREIYAKALDRSKAIKEPVYVLVDVAWLMEGSRAREILDLAREAARASHQNMEFIFFGNTSMSEASLEELKRTLKIQEKMLRIESGKDLIEQVRRIHEESHPEMDFSFQNQMRVIGWDEHWVLYGPELVRAGVRAVHGDQNFEKDQWEQLALIVFCSNDREALLEAMQDMGMSKDEALELIPKEGGVPPLPLIKSLSQSLEITREGLDVSKKSM